MQRMQKKLERYENGGSRPRDVESSTSRQSHKPGREVKKSNVSQQEVIPERDASLEQTGGDYLYM